MRGQMVMAVVAAVGMTHTMPETTITRAVTSNRMQFAQAIASRAESIVALPTQPPPRNRKPAQNETAVIQLSPELLSLDEYIIKRFRGAELLPDSSGPVITTRGTDVLNGDETHTAGARPNAQRTDLTHSDALHNDAPRIDGLRIAERRDTLVAVHFDTVFWNTSLATGATVRFVDPSGDVSSIAGRISARRAFRAPRKPNARRANANDWRTGWAYLVAIPMRTANAAASGFNGWSVVEARLSNTKRMTH